jgi:two-component SAPR family response regulator
MLNVMKRIKNHLPDISPDEDGIFRGNAAKEMLKFLLQETDKGTVYSCLRTDKWRVRGFYKDLKTQKWIAFDNRSYDCFVEEFESESVAYDWVCDKFDISY